LAKKVRAILNKLTPQKFTTLVEQFQELPIDSEAKLSKSMELIFEKALDEPAFSVAYAHMCRILQLKKVPKDGEDGNPEPGTEVTFRKLLISRCQREFEKDCMEGLNKETYLAQMADPNLSDAEKNKLKEEYEAMEMKARRRSCGNIRFIGELYKLQMLTVGIMHECVRKLLKETDEESLKCLCLLMTTVGQELESDTKSRIEKEGTDQRLRPIETYFREMIKIIEEKKTSSRVRFLMQDVVDLRANGWKKRREDAGPKTIDQIHEEVD
jgi:translation initiation factor 4G